MKNLKTASIGVILVLLQVWWYFVPLESSERTRNGIQRAASLSVSIPGRGTGQDSRFGSLLLRPLHVSLEEMVPYLVIGNIL